MKKTKKEPAIEAANGSENKTCACKIKRRWLIGLAVCGFVLIVCGGYMTWNRLDPDRTCAQCHEVAPAHERWLSSAHAEVSCIECHGTAMSNGIHSLTEKANMVFTHFGGKKHNDDIHLSEEQVLEVADRCASCHRAEYAGWLAGGHAVTYKEIFMDSTHNAMEKPYWDCFRCHGMFYEGNIHDLMSLEGDQTQWHIKDEKQADKPAVPCLACHRMHTPNPVSERYVSMTGKQRVESERNPVISLYVRADKIHLRADMLTPVRMLDGERVVDMAKDPATLLCMQCHSPNYHHEAGTEDDRTVTGAHEGIGCTACHKPHSGTTKESCAVCHPSLTEQQVKDVFAAPHTYKK